MASPFEVLPLEVLYQILEKLPVRSLPAVSRVSRVFYTSCQDERLWRKEIIKFDPKLEDFHLPAVPSQEVESVPSPRLCHTCVVWKDSMYIHGGHNTLAASQVFSEIKNDLWRYKFDERRWEKIPNDSLPYKTEHSAVVYDNKMWLFGGYSGELFTNTLYCYDFYTNECTFVETRGHVPVVRSAHIGAVYRDKMYIFGGWNGNDQNNDLYSYEFATKTWVKIQCKGTVPLPRCSHSAAVSDTFKSLFVFAGYGGKSQRYLNDLCQFNFETGTWSIISNTMPSPRSRMRLVEFQDKIYVYGGWNKDEHFNNLFQYDVEKRRWRELQLDTEGDEGKIGQHSMVVYNNILYIFAGYNSSTRTSTNDLYAYRLSKPQQAV